MCAVVIDCFYGNAQESCDVFGLCDTKFDECINAHFGGEMLFVVAGVELFFGWQVSIEVFDESREEGEEGFVEMLVELV